MLPINDMKEIVKETIIELLEKDKEFRYAVAGAIGLQEILKRLDKHEEILLKHTEELVKLREDMNKLREDMVAGFRRYDEILLRHEEEIKKLREDMVAGFKRVDEILLKHDEEIKKLREDMIAGFRRHDEEIAKLREDMIAGFRRHDEEIAKLREDTSNGFKLLRNQVSAIGARWGIMSENAFRAGIKGIVEEEFGMKVERWVKRDVEGFVFGYPSDIEFDIAISDGRIIIIEIKSSISQGDVIAFRRKVEFYQRETGSKPSRLVIVTPFADEKAIELAKNFGIEILNA
ncbi:MAG: DUF3782 domain-containing protein [Archaeoglobaceae archaeon]|nr:DUF3782 domain-containing protein [Archaeoglobaceae archaeon]